MKVKRIVLTVLSVAAFIAGLKACEAILNLYPSPDLEGRISTPIYAKDTGVQPREYGEMFKKGYMSEIRIRYKIDERIRDASEDFPNYS